MKIPKKDLWPHRITVELPVEDLTRERWLNEQVGMCSIAWNALYFHNKTEFYFRNAQDAALFALRWA